MALVIGLTWAFAFAAAFTRQDILTGRILTYLFIISNTLQGVFIFVVFVCNRRVYKLYKEAIRKLLVRISNSSASKKTSDRINRFLNVLHRTESVDTVMSTISNSSSNSKTNDSKLKSIEEE
ncbi:g-protein coupled receptor Mth2 [Caerostris extrusa]|uniref:G-protein coupled receptor Mth2 n=1 Tax=Caerostris extrusa TaxID=172846 RepID=A0AAV4NMJ0_CAEEX|nr:g-protein coupled receptor Mth2 [Caerostris extrusa]